VGERLLLIHQDVRLCLSNRTRGPAKLFLPKPAAPIGAINNLPRLSFFREKRLLRIGGGDLRVWARALFCALISSR